MSTTNKYPRTFHLPWSPGATSDDKRMSDVLHFVGKRVIVTEKMDGENTTIYKGGCHARSLDTATHPSRDKVRALAGRISHLLRDGLSIVGENVYAKHSIHYTALPAHFLAFGVHFESIVAGWSHVEDVTRFGVKTVPILYQGVWDETLIKACWTGESKYGGEQEGYVVRIEDAFSLSDFDKWVAKYVRADHVQTDDHWLAKKVVVNGLAK